MSDRIKLAKAMGIPERRHYGVSHTVSNQQFDPFTDANDCEALIKHLNSLGWQVEVHWQFTNDKKLAAGCFVHIWNRDSEEHHRLDLDVDRWKEAVCRIAVVIVTPCHSDIVYDDGFMGTCDPHD